MATKTEETMISDEGPEIRSYASPRLVAYGSIRDLTRGGQGSTLEGVGNSSKKRPG